MSVKNPIVKVSFCGTFQMAVKPKRSTELNLPLIIEEYHRFPKECFLYYEA